jgi:hypothetical protein
MAGKGRKKKRLFEWPRREHIGKEVMCPTEYILDLCYNREK